MMKTLLYARVAIIITILSMMSLGSNTTPVRAVEPFFTVHMWCPTNVATRMVWAGIIASQWESIGIHTEIHFADEPTVDAHGRTLPPEKWGATFAEGGFDMIVEVWGIGLVADIASFFHSDSTPPPNFGMYSNSESDRLIEEFEASYRNITRANEILAEWQRLAYDDITPWMGVFIPKYLYVANPKLEGVTEPMAGVLGVSRPEEWTIQGETDATCIMAVSRDFQYLGGIHARGYLTQNYVSGVFDTLARRPYGTQDTLPRLATDWTVSEDGKTIVINLRQDVKWHDGWEFNATDVKFTWDTVLNPETGSPDYYNLGGLLESKDNYEITGPYQITINLPKPKMFWDQILWLGQPMAPWHALKDILPQELRTHTYTTGVGTYEVTKPDGTIYTATGPIGTGPYRFVEYDPVARTTEITRNDEYWGEIQGNIKTYMTVVITDVMAGLSAIRYEEVTLLHHALDVSMLVGEIDPSWGKIISLPSTSLNFIGLNFNHPVYGTGVDTPAGQEDPSKAAEAALNVRWAMSVAIPRQQIIEQIKGGYALQPKTVITRMISGSIDDELPEIPFNLTLAREYLSKAGYPALAAPTPPSFWEEYGLAISGIAIAVAVVCIVYAVYVRKK